MQASRRLRALPRAASSAAGQIVPRRTRILAATIAAPALPAKQRRWVLEPDRELNMAFKPTVPGTQGAGLEAGTQDLETATMQKQRQGLAGGPTATGGAYGQESDGTTSSDDEITAARSRQLPDRGKARQRRHLRQA